MYVTIKQHIFRNVKLITVVNFSFSQNLICMGDNMRFLLVVQSRLTKEILYAVQFKLG